MINIISSSRYKVNRVVIRDCAKKILEKNNIDDHEIVNLVFMGKNKMKTISAKYKKEDVALPVLTFIYKNKSPHESVFGEVLLCYPQIVLLAAERNKRVDDMILQMVEHGISNLLK